MEMPASRLNYQLLRQPLPQERQMLPTSMIGLQRDHSSGSSCNEEGVESEMSGYFQEDEFRDNGVEAREAVRFLSPKSWAQQTEETYQLQLALALRVSTEATCADDPNFLDAVPDESAIRSSSASPEALSHRFWVNGCLSYFDKVPNGFYIIHGMDPYVWTVCTDLKENGRVPSIDSLKAIYPSNHSPIEVILFDKSSDPVLKELENRVLGFSCSFISTKQVVDELAKLVCNQLGGAACSGEEGLISCWKDCVDVLKDCLGSVVFSLGRLSVGLCKHRALLFKVLADAIDLPCRIAKGCKYCRREDSASCLVRFGLEREYLVDLIGKPGCLCEPDSLLNGPSCISISSPLRLPKFKPVETIQDFSSLAKLYFLSCQSLDFVSGNDPTEMNPLCAPSQMVSKLNGHGRNMSLLSSSNPQNIRNSIPLQVIPPDARGHPAQACRNLGTEMSRDRRYMEGALSVRSRATTEASLDGEDFNIPWSDIVLKENIGSGSFGTVHLADWRGSVGIELSEKLQRHRPRGHCISYKKSIPKRRIVWKHAISRIIMV